MTSGLSLVSRYSFTNGLGVASSAVFSTRASGLVSLSQASWLAGSPISESPSRDRVHTSARSASLIDALPSPRSLARAATTSATPVTSRNSLPTGSSTRCVVHWSAVSSPCGGCQPPEGALWTLIFHSLGRRRWIRCGNRGVGCSGPTQFDLQTDHPYRYQADPCHVGGGRLYPGNATHDM